MSYRAPKIKASEQVQKPEEPLINLAAVSDQWRREKSKQGYLSTFLSGNSSSTPQGFLSSALSKTQI